MARWMAMLLSLDRIGVLCWRLARVPPRFPTNADIPVTLVELIGSLRPKKTVFSEHPDLRT